MAIEFTELTKPPLKVPGLLQISDPVTGACLVLSGPDLQVLYWANQLDKLAQGKGSPTLQRYLLERPTTVFTYAYTRKYTGREVSNPLNKQLMRTGQHITNYLTEDAKVDICLVVTSTGHRFYCSKSDRVPTSHKSSQLATLWNSLQPTARNTVKTPRLTLAKSKHWRSEEFAVSVIRPSVPMQTSKQCIAELSELDRRGGLPILD